MLEVENAVFAYPGCAQVISGLSLSLARGERLAVVGENGSGKTTLARLLCGLIQPTAGSVRVDGLDTRDPEAIYEVRRRVGLVFQDPDDQMVETTVEREVAFGPRNLGLAPDEVDLRVKEALDTFSIQHLAGRPAHLLSAGEKQLVAVASVFAMQPDYLILDESTSLLDRRARLAVGEAVEHLLRKTGAGLVFISMRLEDVWTCGKVIVLESGGVGFRGCREDLVAHLRAAGVPLAGLGLLASELAQAVPGFLAALARQQRLTGDDVAAALTGRAGTGAEGEFRREGAPGQWGPAAGGDPCR